MVNFIFHHDPKQLPEFNNDIHPVQLYDLHPWDKVKHSSIARPVIKIIRDLGTPISSLAFDFLTISMAVTASDTFFDRNNSANSWARQFTVKVPLYNPKPWKKVAGKLEKALGFLTGDQWKLIFEEGGLNPPDPKTSNKAKHKKKSLQTLNCVSLFSGGLDSAVGAIDLINSDSGYEPLLVSHAYKGDAAKQHEVESVLLKNKYSRFAMNADPHLIVGKNLKTDITMRGRSFNFIAMALVGLSALQGIAGNNAKKVFIPENGYISLNPPLTRRRIGSLSTRTTHPYYLAMLQEIFSEVGLNVLLVNPYQFKTKGEMVSNCKDQSALSKAIPSTVSCSNWHRKKKQCGRCLPCLIRRAAISRGSFSIDASYIGQNLPSVLKYKNERDDLFAVIAAYTKLTKGANSFSWVRSSGPLPIDQDVRNDLVSVFERGLFEVGDFLKNESVI